jgi:hypothetical protein
MYIRTKNIILCIQKKAQNQHNTIIYIHLCSNKTKAILNIILYIQRLYFFIHLVVISSDSMAVESEMNIMDGTKRYIELLFSFIISEIRTYLKEQRRTNDKLKRKK